MRAWLIVNGFLHSGKFDTIHSWLLDAAAVRGVDMHLYRNDEMPIHMGGGSVMRERPDFVLFWDKDVRLAAFLEELGIPVYNSSGAIADCDDKSRTHLKLFKAGIPMPETILAPMTFDNIGYTNLDFLDSAAECLGYPMVVKECFGSFGAQVYLAKDRAQLEAIVGKTKAKPILFQKFIAGSAGRDVRLQAVGDRVIASMYRYSVNGDFRANITNGGHMKPYRPAPEETELALRCMRALNLDFAGIDLLFGEDGPVVCEVNSNAHFKNIYDCTGVNAAERIIDYVIQDRRKKGRESG